MTGSCSSIDGRREPGTEAGTGGSKLSGITKFSWAMTEPSSSGGKSSRSRYLLRLLERPAEPSEPERSLWVRKPGCGDAPRLRLDSRDSSWLLRLMVGMRDRNVLSVEN